MPDPATPPASSRPALRERVARVWRDGRTRQAARRLAATATRRARTHARRGVARVTGPAVRLRSAGATRRANEAFREELARRAGAPGASPAVVALARRTDIVFASRGAGALAARSGVLPWSAPRLGLRRLAVDAGWVALDDDALTTARWLASALAGGTTSRAVQDFQAAVAARDGDWATALTWQRRRHRAVDGERSPRADAWVNRARRHARIADLLDELADRLGEPELRRTARALRVARPDAGAQARLDALIGARVAEGGDLTVWRPVFAEYAAARRPETVFLAAPEVAASVRTMSVQTFRTFVTGRSVCLVANSPRLIGSGLGPLIDGYDVVIRFNSFVLVPEDTGRRTDVHATIHLHDYNWDVPVAVRIVLSGRQELWRESLKVRLRPGAQQWLGDASLRWPARDLGLIAPNEPFRTPTAGFNLLRLLLHLDVSPVIDLIGFDFYEAGKLRLPAAMSVPHSAAHDSAAERAWVMAHATGIHGLVTSMRRPHAAPGAPTRPLEEVSA